MKKHVKQGLFGHSYSRVRLTDKTTPPVAIQTAFKEIDTLQEVPIEIKQHIAEYVDNKSLLIILQYVSKEFYKLVENICISERFHCYDINQQANLSAFTKNVLASHQVQVKYPNTIEQPRSPNSLWHRLLGREYNTTDERLVTTLLSTIPFKEGEKFLLLRKKYQDLATETLDTLTLIANLNDYSNLMYIANREQSLIKTFRATNCCIKAKQSSLVKAVAIHLGIAFLMKTYAGLTNDTHFSCFNLLKLFFIIALVFYIVLFVSIFNHPNMARRLQPLNPYKHELLTHIEKIAQDEKTSVVIDSFNALSMEKDEIETCTVNTQSS